MNRRILLTVLANTAAFASLGTEQVRAQQPKGAGAKNQRAMNEIAHSGGSLVVAQWEAKEGQADTVAAILRHFLPEAQNDPGVKLFLIGRGKENPAQFLFYELFVDDAAIAAHRASEYFKIFIAEQALPLLSKRESKQYSLL
jgi:quinol monooxygenase YgiN